MNKNTALASLGLSGNEDAGTIARVYGERLSAVQSRLVTAATDADRGECQKELSDLVDAYEFVTATGRYTQAGTDDASATVMRPIGDSSGRSGPGNETSPRRAPAGDTLVRMDTGSVLSDRLEIGPLLGQGGMGSVYAARDRLKEEDVAIKVLRQDLLFSPEAKDRFLAEAKVSCSLSHPNIVRVHDVGMSGGYYYLSMERLRGQSLRQRIQAYRAENRGFEVAEVTEIARQLIDALRYAHRYIVHRDLKPDNIWLAEDGTVKLMDFGIARAYSNSHLTQTGMSMGTAYYMAPEQSIDAKDVDWRADQYSLGVVLYELLTDTLPAGAVKPVETVRRDVPKRYARAVMRAMAAKPRDRFGSLEELLAEIEAPARMISPRVGGLLLAGLGLAAAAAGAFVYIGNPANAPSAMPPGAEAEAAYPSSPEVAASVLTAASGPASSPAPSQIGASPLDVPPPLDPPPSDEPAKAAAALVPESRSPARVVPSADRRAVDAQAQRVAVADQSRRDSRRQQCLSQCERDAGECRSLNRRGKQDCMRAIAFGSSGRLTTTNPATASCAFFGPARCEHAFERDACLARVSIRHDACMDVLGKSIASGRKDCEDNARESDRLCLDEVRECRAAC